MIKIPYGKEYIEMCLDNYQTEILLPRIPEVLKKVDEIITNSLSNPLGALKAYEFSGKSIGITINDPTRPVPHKDMLPKLVELLKNNGAKRKNITFYLSNGTHKSIQIDKIKQYLPELIWRNYTIKNHDCDDLGNLLFLKNSKAGTPVYINKGFYFGQFYLPP